MSIFRDVTLRWDGDDYTVPADRVMGLIARIEDHVSIAHLTRADGPPLSRLAGAYAEALRYAGADVSPEDVYSAMFTDGAAEAGAAAVTGLLMLMIPPDTMGDAPTTAAKKKRPSKKG